MFSLGAKVVRNITKTVFQPPHQSFIILLAYKKDRKHDLLNNKLQKWKPRNKQAFNRNKKILSKLWPTFRSLKQQPKNRRYQQFRPKRKNKQFYDSLLPTALFIPTTP